MCTFRAKQLPAVVALAVVAVAAIEMPMANQHPVFGCAREAPRTACSLLAEGRYSQVFHFAKHGDAHGSKLNALQSADKNDPVQTQV